MVLPTPIPLDTFKAGHLDSNFEKKNAFLDQKTGQPIPKVLVFMALVGSNNGALYREVKRNIDKFDMFCVNIPKDPREFSDLLRQKQDELQEDIKILKATTEKIRTLILTQLTLQSDTNISLIEEHQLYIHREKQILDAKCFLQADEGDLQKFYLWTPDRMEETLTTSLKGLKESVDNFTDPSITKVPKDQVNSALKCRSKTPTSYMLNDLTHPFNMIVNTYAIQKYKEINPAIFTVSSFPFFVRCDVW